MVKVIFLGHGDYINVSELILSRVAVEMSAGCVLNETKS